MDVGFIGLGQMGLAMARNLLKAGHHVTAYNRTRARAEELKTEGATVAARPADACNGEVLISILADDRAIEETLLGQDNLVARLLRDSVHVCMSTISVALARRLAETHATTGSAYVSAPVFGRPDAAAAGKLFVVASGPEKSIERCRPLFDVIGQKTFVVGEDPTAATVVKLAGNFMIASAIETMGEAFALLRKSGVEPAKFLEVMTGSLFAAPVYKNYGDIIANQRFQPAGFKVPLGLKDARLVLAAAEAAAAPMPIAGIVRDHLLTVLARGGQELDWSSLGRVPAENAGL
jgi:3-hydroxyisobutyrate dehydrogenase-like beta-hydroxyacid dehydrogenase